MKKVKPNQTYNMHQIGVVLKGYQINNAMENACLLYTSPSPRDSCASRMPSSA